MPDSADAVLLNIFAEEAEELLESCDGAQQQLADQSQREKAVDALLRALHTLKGAARSVGLSGMGDFTHAFESWLKDWQKLDPKTLSDLSRRAIDALHTMREHVTQGGAPMASGAGFASLLSGEADEPETTPQPTPTTDEITAAPQNLRIAAQTIDELRAQVDQAAVNASQLYRKLLAAQQLLDVNATAMDASSSTAKSLQAELAQQLRRQSQSGQQLDRRAVDTITRMQLASANLSNQLSEQCGSLRQLSRQIDQAKETAAQQGVVTTSAGQQLLSTRLLAFSDQRARLDRVVRQTCSELGQEAELSIDGGDMLIDRALLEKLLGPIEHLLRNSIAHGIESPAKRKGAGKPMSGRLHIALTQQHGRITIAVSDDGQGINSNKVRDKAIANGLITADAELDEPALQRLILEPGFSTADAVSQVAGRGVGMDVVADAVRSLGGALDIQSTTGQGACFTVRVPLNLATLDCLIVSAGEQRFGIPIEGVTAIHRLSVDQTFEPAYAWNGTNYRIESLATWLGRKADAMALDSKLSTLLMADNDPIALTVAATHELRTLLIQPLPPLLAGTAGLLGIGRDETGDNVLLLDVADLFARGPLPKPKPPAAKPRKKNTRSLLAVDDSPTIRMAVQMALRGRDWEISTANDGQQALDALEIALPDLVLLDIDMPNLDGIECLRRIRAHPMLKTVPVIMYTGAENRGREREALSAGANGFMLKTVRGRKFVETLERLYAQLAPKSAQVASD